YWWKEKIEQTEEWLCIMKSRSDLYDELEEAIKNIHPYEVPEIVAVPIVSGSQSYLEWLDNEVRSSRVKGG
ncbi:MAG: divalent-cation tolerance protein CutA, partial [Deltaproteobacteria bacterium]